MTGQPCRNALLRIHFSAVHWNRTGQPGAALWGAILLARPVLDA